jgi:hypothetical protein
VPPDDAGEKELDGGWDELTTALCCASPRTVDENAEKAPVRGVRGTAVNSLAIEWSIGGASNV